MKQNQSNRANGKQSSKKLTFLFILLPILVVALMVVFWVIFQETRKHVTTDVKAPATQYVSLMSSLTDRKTKPHS